MHYQHALRASYICVCCACTDSFIDTAKDNHLDTAREKNGDNFFAVTYDSLSTVVLKFGDTAFENFTQHDEKDTQESLTVEFSPHQCASFCEGKQCGDDGCGGICGTCTPSLACACNGAHFVCAYMTGLCGQQSLCEVITTNTECDDNVFCTKDSCDTEIGCVFNEIADCCTNESDCG